LDENGFTKIFPNMLWGGVAHYASDILPRSETFKKYGDQIAQCCEAAHRHSLEVHVWKVNFNLLNAPKAFVEKMRSQRRLQVSAQGKSQNWLCPSNPKNQQLELDSMLEVVKKYPVDGLHFDYIRYPDDRHCYCDGCRRRFESDSGKKVSDENWPEECYSGPRKQEYRDWRCQQITNLVATVHREAKKIRPGIQISAAVFGAYPGCRDSVGQDWLRWVKDGDLDFLCPMNYTTNNNEFSGLVRTQLKQIGGRIPILPGIGATATNISMSPEQITDQIQLARSLGAAGFTLFDFTPKTAQKIIPVLRRQTSRQQSTRPPGKG
jgi:uncharacterized lipoprotein YddW (UPF0748 family)